jgi:hypothetical protein
MIGIMSIVTMLTAGMGAKAALVDEIEMSWDTRMIIVSSLDTTRKDMLITDAVVTKMEKLDKVSAVYPVLQANGREKMGNFYGYDSILGVPTEYLEVLGVKEGSLPTRNGARPELLMGTGFRRALYNDKTWMPFSESSKAEMSFIGKKIDFLPEKIDSGYATSTDADSEYSYEMSILKSNNGDPSACNRYTFSYDVPLAGEAHFIHTYMGDGNPLPSFEGEPTHVSFETNDLDEFTDLVWNALDEDNKVSLFTRFIDIKTGNVETRIVNKNK